MKQDNQQQQNQALFIPQWLRTQAPDVKIQSNQRFVAQPQSLQGKDSSLHYTWHTLLLFIGSQTIQNQPQFQSNLSSTFSKANLTLFPFSRSKSTNVCWNSSTERNAFRRFVYSFYNRSLNFTDHIGFQSQNTREQDQTWQNKNPTQQTQSNQIFAFKPTQRSGKMLY